MNGARSPSNAVTDTPGYAYYQSLWKTELNWQFETIPQVGANNSQLAWPRGKVLGGWYIFFPRRQRDG